MKQVVLNSRLSRARMTALDFYFIGTPSGRRSHIVRLVVLSLILSFQLMRELKKAARNKASKANSRPRMENPSNSRLRRCFRNTTEVCSRMD